jgi:hypothetical protein
VIEERSNIVNYAKAPSGKRENIRGPRLPGILTYHAIARVAEDPNRICVSPRRFEAQMGHLKRRGQSEPGSSSGSPSTTVTRIFCTMRYRY